jgi:hypothetical protein
MLIQEYVELECLVPDKKEKEKISWFHLEINGYMVFGKFNPGSWFGNLKSVGSNSRL